MTVWSEPIQVLRTEGVVKNIMLSKKLSKYNVVCSNLTIWFIGMGYRPHPPDAKIESTLIWYRWKKRKRPNRNYQHLIQVKKTAKSDLSTPEQKWKIGKSAHTQLDKYNIYSGTVRQTATGTGQNKTSDGTAGSKMISKWVFLFFEQQKMIKR